MNDNIFSSKQNKRVRQVLETVLVHITLPTTAFNWTIKNEFFKCFSTLTMRSSPSVKQRIYVSRMILGEKSTS